MKIAFLCSGFGLRGIFAGYSLRCQATEPGLAFSRPSACLKPAWKAHGREIWREEGAHLVIFQAEGGNGDVTGDCQALRLPGRGRNTGLRLGQYQMAE